jgi:tryptophan synthase alpha chain
MAHLVAGYPDRDTAVEIAAALAAGGASMLELQMPSSDPAADGPVIQKACSTSLAAGFRLDEGFAAASGIHRATRIPLYIMAYGSQIYARGIDRFVLDTRDTGAEGIIAPDLTAGSDEGLYDSCRRAGIECVPVIPVTVADERVDDILSFAGTPAWAYIALRAGITGLNTILSPRSIELLSRLRKGGIRTIAGFGISSPEQILALSDHSDAVVAGSVFVRAADTALLKGLPPGPAVRDAVEMLLDR